MTTLDPRRSGHDAKGRGSLATLELPLLDVATTDAATRSRRTVALATGLAAVALATLGLFASTRGWMGGWTAGGIALATSALLAARHLARGESTLRFEHARLSLHSERGDAALFGLADLFGVQLFTNPRRDRLCVWVSTERETVVFGADLGARDRAALRSWLLRSSVLGDDDPTLSSAGPDGRPLRVRPHALVRALAWLEQRSPGCVGRIVVSDQRGRPLVLEEQRLTVGGRDVRLDEPLDWHAGLFREQLGEGIGLYQGTWLSQGRTSFVLVAPLTSTFVDAALGGAALSSERDLDELARRDQSLLRAKAELPPEPSHRVAIDASLVVPIRAALDRAPRAVRRTNAPRWLS